MVSNIKRENSFIMLLISIFFLVSCTDETKSNTNDYNLASNQINETIPNNEVDNSNDDINETIPNNEVDNSNDNINKTIPKNEVDNTNNNINETIPNSDNKTEYHEVYAERTLVIDIDVPFEISNNYIGYLISAKNGKAVPNIKDKNQIYYTPTYGFIGEDVFSFEIYDKNSNRTMEKKYIINIIKAPLDGNRDFIISHNCENSLGSYSTTIDIEIVDDNLNIIEQVYDDYKKNSFWIPDYSRIEIDYQGIEDLFSMNHHNKFKENIKNNILITCNYPNGYKSLMLPIKDNKDWYANRKNRFTEKFSRNDLYFNISHLSDLHTQIYLKEYQHTLSFNESFEKASQFIENNFPNANYTAELAQKYNTHPLDPIISGQDSLYKRFSESNEKYNDLLYNLAEEVSNGNIFKLIEKIANNYESFYLSGDNQCLDKTICATFFPEYTISLTTNPDFNNSLNGWANSKVIHNIAVGELKYLPSTNIVSLELRANIPNNIDEPISSIDLYQTQILNTDNIDDYFLYFDLANALGASDGGASFSMCISSSGFTGAYALFRDKDNKQIGLLAWTDHCNKFDYAWSGRNGIDSTDKFHNVRLRDVVRRVNPNETRFEYMVNIGEMTQKYLPLVYAEKAKIYSIEYGIFTTEHRNPENGCYYCEAKIKAHEINLLKIKK